MEAYILSLIVFPSGRYRNTHRYYLKSCARNVGPNIGIDPVSFRVRPESARSSVGLLAPHIGIGFFFSISDVRASTHIRPPLNAETCGRGQSRKTFFDTIPTMRSRSCVGGRFSHGFVTSDNCYLHCSGAFPVIQFR